MNLLKKLVAALLTFLATALGYPEYGDIALGIPAMAGAIYFLVELIKGFTNFKDDLIFTLSWVLGGILGLSLWFLDAGIFEGLPWYIAIVLGVASAGVANVTYTAEWLEAILAWFIPYYRKKQELREQKKSRVERL